MANPQRFENDLRKRRTMRGWSQEQLAHRSGLSRAGISAIETNRLIPSAAAALALAAALEADPTRDGHQSATERSDDEGSLLRAMAARAALTSGSSGWSSDQLAMVNTLVSHGANREDFKALTPERFVQFCEAWLQMDDRISKTQCVVCGNTFTYERKGRPPLTCSAECRRNRNNKSQTRPAD